jgi:serine protease DegS
MMKVRAALSLVAKSIVVGLAAAFVSVLIWPDLIESSLPAHDAINRPLIRSQGPVSYSDAVSRAMPSVVSIYIAKVRVQKGPTLFRDPLFQHFFGNRSQTTQKRLETSLGSGVIIGRGGYILTNHHVIAGADRIQVATPQGGILDVELIGTDEDTDLAVLRASDHQLPAIPLGANEPVGVGDVVLAIGNPFGVGQTVTMGIISATGRNKLGINTFENFIQTDAAINPGNSGGALINAHGELVGINTAIFSKSGGSLGIGFAIPADLALNVMEEIVKHGRVKRGWMGISAQDMTSDLARTFDLKDVRGALVTGVVNGGPADEGGLNPGDIVTGIDQAEVSGTADLTAIIASAKPDQKVILSGWRGTKRFRVHVHMIERPRQRRLLR